MAAVHQKNVVFNFSKGLGRVRLLKNIYSNENYFIRKLALDQLLI